MNNLTNDFSKGNIINHIVKLAVPMMLAQLVNILYNIIDRIYIGRIPVDATNALTGLGVVFPICTVTIAFANLVSSGATPLFSMERGKGNNEEAGRLMGNSFVMLIFLGLVISILVNLFKRPLLLLLGASDTTYGYADSYISIYMMGNVFVMLSLGLNAFINAQGFAKTGMVTVSIGAVLNILLDPVFIFYFNMGVKGAALATIISQFFAAIWTLWFLLGKRTIIRLSYKNFKLDFKRVINILSLGLAGFTMAITNSLVQMVCNINLSTYGGDIYIGAMTVINSIRELAMMPVTGIERSAQPIISFNYGATENHRVKKTIKYSAYILLSVTSLTWIIIMLFAKQFILMFNQDAELLNIGVKSMHIYFFGFFMMTFQFIGQIAFTALGRSKKAIFFSLLRKVFIVIPLTFILPMVIGVDGVFYAEPISNFIGGTACCLTMYLTEYKKL
ncbi:MAG: MATE family efflux transporter [Eubacteriales bacterium]|nr:MATE family efflux transporter [Eubacteriales bacterium]